MPTGGPPTTAPKPGAKPAPPPDPTPVLEQVQADLDQLNAIADYQPAQVSVSQAQAAVTAIGARLLAARQTLNTAQQAEASTTKTRSLADAKLRELAIAAYTGVGYSAPSLSPGSGDTPGGLSAPTAADAQQMMAVLGQKAEENDKSAHHSQSQATQAVRAATVAFQQVQNQVGAAEAILESANQTLKTITTAAIMPGAAATTALPTLTAIEHPGATPALPATVPTTSTTTTTTVPGAPGAVAGTDGGAMPVYNGPPPSSPLILSAPELDGSELAAWFASTGRKANVTVPIDKLAAAYQHWGEETGVRYDLAFAQSVIETGYFSFPAGGQLTAADNNFAGIGACDTCAKGWSFPDASTGAEAQMELLYDFATKNALPAKPDLHNVIGGTGIGGCCQTWTELAGRWASSTVYGISIMTVYDQMLTWLIPQRLLAAGLVTPTTAAARGPELAPLPDANPPAPPGPKLAAPPSKPGTNPPPSPTTTVAPGVSIASTKG